MSKKVGLIAGGIVVLGLILLFSVFKIFNVGMNPPSQNQGHLVSNRPMSSNEITLSFAQQPSTQSFVMKKVVLKMDLEPKLQHKLGFKPENFDEGVYAVGQYLIQYHLTGLNADQKLEVHHWYVHYLKKQLEQNNHQVKAIRYAMHHFKYPF